MLISSAKQNKTLIENLIKSMNHLNSKEEAKTQMAKQIHIPEEGKSHSILNKDNEEESGN